MTPVDHSASLRPASLPPETTRASTRVSSMPGQDADRPRVGLAARFFTQPLGAAAQEISICRGFACSAFGTMTVRTPSCCRAEIVSLSTCPGKEKLRLKRP